jgi:hypothetical protein
MKLVARFALPLLMLAPSPALAQDPGMAEVTGSHS